MNKPQHFLMCSYIAYIVVALILVVIGETDVLVEKGIMADNIQGQFTWAIVMELLTICVIPLSLKLFQLPPIKKRINTPHNYLLWAAVRMDMLALPMIVNIVLYYLFYNVAFGYMGIILFLSLFFITPTKQRCEEETGTSSL